MSTGLTTKREAEAATIQKLAELGYLPSKHEPVSLDYLIARYLVYAKTVKTVAVVERDNKTLKDFGSHMGDTLISKVGSEAIQDWIAIRSARVKASTVNRDMNCVRNLFAKAVEWKYLSANPCRFVKRLRTPRRLPDWFTKTEINRILEASPARYRPMWMMFLYTGCRRGELLSLRWEDVKDAVIKIRYPKEGKEKVIPISGELRKVLGEMDRSGDYVLPRLNATSVSNIFGRIVKRAKLKGSLHTLRHSTATHLLMSGTPVQVVQKILGHTSLETTSLYSHALESDMKKAVDSLSFGTPRHTRKRNKSVNH